jgi:hypothetical protein
VFDSNKEKKFVIIKNCFISDTVSKQNYFNSETDQVAGQTRLHVTEVRGYNIVVLSQVYRKPHGSMKEKYGATVQ